MDYSDPTTDYFHKLYNGRRSDTVLVQKHWDTCSYCWHRCRAFEEGIVRGFRRWPTSTGTIVMVVWILGAWSLSCVIDPFFSQKKLVDSAVCYRDIFRLNNIKVFCQLWLQRIWKRHEEVVIGLFGLFFARLHEILELFDVWIVLIVRT